MQTNNVHTWLNKGTKLVVAGVVAVGILASIGTASAQAQFTDVKPAHYAYEAVHWAKEQDIISGYTDKAGKPTGRFGPSDVVTEAQFAKMLATFLKVQDTEGDLPKATAATWSDTHYDALARYAVPLNGYFNQTLRNTAVKRGTVAQTLGYIAGGKDTLQQAVDFLIAEGISTGQNPQFEGKDTLKYFGTANTLTRAQVVTLLYRMDAQAKTKVGAFAASTVAGLDSLTAKASVGVMNVDASLKTGEIYTVTGNPVALVTMATHAKILIELSPQAAPNTVNNFIALAKSGFYDGVTFHRVIPGFMIQGGDPTGTGAGGPNYSIAGEFAANGFINQVPHERGVLSMARTNDPNSAGSQFFLMVEDAPHLDGQYAAFGRVLDGMRTVDTIVGVARNASDKPYEAQVMERVEVETFGKSYEGPVKLK